MCGRNTAQTPLRTLFISILAISISAICAWAQSPANSGNDDHPILVELFTSEGCSSCPPADAFLQKIDTSQPIAGAQLIVLSEHVDYWDHDGWKDPNSSPEMTQRQIDYVHALQLKEPYTPQIVVDGTDVLRANDRQLAAQVFQQAEASPVTPVKLSDVSIGPGLVKAHITADRTPEQHAADVYAAVALDHYDSQVLHGENQGRNLTSVAVVVDLRKVGKLQKGKSFDENVQFKLKPGVDPKNVRLVVFVQEPGPGKVLGAAMQKPEAASLSSAR